MKDKDITKPQLLKEITKLHKQIAKLEKPEAEIKKSMAEIETGKEREQTRNRLAKESVAITSVIKGMLRGDVDNAQTEDRVLEACLAATDSVYGMIGVINEHGKYDTTTYNNHTLQNCAFPEALAWELSTGMTIRGIWGWPMLHGKPLICNDLLTHPDRVGLPKGHVSLQCFLGVPLKRGKKAVGMVAVANKPGGYTHEDRDTLIRLASVISVSRQHRLALTEAKRTSAELEQLVAERTKQLRESEQRFRSFMESATDAFSLFDANLNLVENNKAAMKKFFPGVKKEKVIGKNILELSPDFKETGIWDKYMEVIKTGKPFIKEDFIPHPKFGDIYLSVKAFKVGDGLGMIISEITERKRAEEMLREKEYTIESSSSAIATADLEGNMIYGNPTFLKTWGFDGAKEFFGRHFSDFWVVKDRLDEIMQALRSKGRWLDEIEAIRKDGSLFNVQVSAAMVYDAKGNPIALTSTSIDITERKEAEEQLKKKMHEMERFHRLTVGRENRMIELKEEVNKLLEKKGLRKKYKAPDRIKKSRQKEMPK